MKIYIIHPNKNFNGDINGLPFKNGKSVSLQDSDYYLRMKKFTTGGFTFEDEQGKDCTDLIKSTIQKIDADIQKKELQNPTKEVITMIKEQGRLRFVDTTGKDVTDSIVKLFAAATQASVQKDLENLENAFNVELETLKAEMEKKLKSTRSKTKSSEE